MPKHPVRRCAACDHNWPSMARYNLCPRCQRCTFADTDSEAPDAQASFAEHARLEKIRAFDAECDAAHAAAQDAWVAEWEALLELTPTIPDRGRPCLTTTAASAERAGPAPAKPPGNVPSAATQRPAARHRMQLSGWPIAAEAEEDWSPRAIG
jgi:hypothetical protein